MAITIYIAEEPSKKEACVTWRVADVAQATVYLWALAKRAEPEWAMFWMPDGLERITNDGMRSADVPEDIAEAVNAEVARQNKMTMEAIITDALNEKYRELAATFHGTPDFVQILTQAAEGWAKECYQCFQQV